MKKDDFVIRNSTGVVFQVEQVDHELDCVKLIRLMDFHQYQNTMNVIKTEFQLIEYGHKSWNTLFEFKKKLSQKEDCNIIKVVKDGKLETYPLYLENDPVFNKITQDLKSLTLKNFRPSINEPTKKENVPEPKNKLKLVKSDKKDDLRDYDDSENHQIEDIDFLILEPDHRDSLDTIILHPQTRKAIEQALIKLEFKDILQKEWAPSLMNKNLAKNCALNFYGPPGTGKTITVKALASILNKKIVQVDFSNLLSKFVGETGKNIKKYFDKAKELDAILFFDEADTLLHSRAGSGSGGEQYNIQNQNIFMQELDRFDGIAIMTTNHFNNYDEAQVRRLTHIEYFLPTDEMRKKIITNHLPVNFNVSSLDLIQDLVNETKGFSGGDISNMIEQVLLNQLVSVRKQNITSSKEEVSLLIKKSVFDINIFKEEIDKIKNAKNNFKGLDKKHKSITLT